MSVKQNLLPCPRCGEPEANIGVYLGDLADDNEPFKCADCDESFTIGELRHLIGSWSVILAWLDTIPQPQKEKP